MYIVLEDSLTEYHDIAALDFAPEADLVGDSLPICQYTVEIRTEDDIERGQWALLMDDIDNLWARYIVTDSDRLDRRTLRIVAQSPIYPIDKLQLSAIYYEDEPVENVLEDTLTPLDAYRVRADAYELDPSYNGTLITGFCPEQTARERLQWLCYALGAVVRQAFNRVVQIEPRDNGNALIPLGQTYMRPKVSYREIVTAVNVYAYTFTEGSPQTTDEWVTDGETYWIVGKQKMTLINPDIPTGVTPNPVTIEGVYLINTDNASNMLNLLGAYYFQRTTLQLACVANHWYFPGQRVTAYVDRGALMSGRISGMRFTFGKQAKADMEIEVVTSVTGAQLTINYMWNEISLGYAVFTLPTGYAYSFENPYIDKTISAHRYIFRPLNAAATGTMPATDTVVTEQCTPALDLYQGILTIISVDSFTEVPGKDSEGNPITIGVIA